jgi:hypothetical protein
LPLIYALKQQFLANDRGSKNDQNTNTKHSIHSAQQTAVLGTSHKMKKVLQCETGVLNGGGRCWFSGRWNGERRDVTGDNNNDNNSSNVTKFVRKVAHLYGVDSTLFFTNPDVQ